MALRLSETTGSFLSEDFIGTSFSITIGSRGSDTFDARTGNEFTIFMGGKSNDGYQVAVPDSSIIILDTGSTSDMLFVTGIGFNSSTTSFATIEGKHLLMNDSASGQQVLILNWQITANIIENIQFSDGLVTYDELSGSLAEKSNFVGDISWEESGVLQGLYTGAEVEEAISFYTNVEFYIERSAEPVITGTEGDDTLVGTFALDDTIDGGAGNDNLSSGSGNSQLNGDDGDDILEGGAGADALDGGTGRDTVSYAGSSAGVTVKLWNQSATGGDADGDTLFSFENAIGSAFNDTLVGDNGENSLEGGDGNDRLFGSGDDDILEGGAGADRLDAGSGSDTVSYAGSSAGVTVKLWNQSATGGDADGDTLISFENVIGSEFNDTLVGDNAGNSITGEDGDDRLFGSGGNDKLEGGAGADRLDGGAGVDAASYADSSVGVTVSLSSFGNASGDAAGDNFISIENLIGSDFADSLTGDNNNNVLEGGAGGDSLNGGAGRDAASYAGSSASVTVKLWNGTGTGGDATGDSFTSIENLIGSEFNDTLVGDNAKNQLQGGEGNDRLFSGGGNDTLEGGTGADRLDGGSGIDTASYAGSEAGVTVKLWNSSGTSGDAQGDTFSSIENVTGSNFNDTLSGDSGVNRLEGGAGNDRLFGGNGDDTLRGGTGNDRLFGQSGADTFAFDGNWGDDTIADFEDGVDLLDFSGSGLALDALTISQSGNDTLIEDFAGNSITLQGVSATDITADDFLF